MFRIAWMSNVTGLKSYGKDIFKTQEECKEECDKANKKFPKISHWPEEVN